MLLTEEEILEWYNTVSNMEKIVFYRTAHKMVSAFVELEEQNDRLRKENQAVFRKIDEQDKLIEELHAFREEHGF